METNCHVCNSVDTELLYKNLKDLTFKTTKETFDLYSCNNCDAKFQHPLMPEDKVGQYYPDSYDPFNNIKKTIIPINNKKNPQSVYLSYLHSKHNKNDEFSLIDVGCGGGNFLNSVNHYFPNAKLFGVDVSEIAIENLKKNNIDGTCNSLYDFSTKIKFDYITASQVLEHLNRPHDFIKKITEIAKPNATFMIDVPASDGYAAKKYKENWVHWDLPRHSIIYSKKSLTHLLKDNFTTINLNFAGTYTAIRSSKKISKNKDIYTPNFIDNYVIKYASPILKIFNHLYTDKIYWIGKMKNN